jgi:hypothetical protein
VTTLGRVDALSADPHVVAGEIECFLKELSRREVRTLPETGAGHCSNSNLPLGKTSEMRREILARAGVGE